MQPMLNVTQRLLVKILSDDIFLEAYCAQVPLRQRDLCSTAYLAISREEGFTPDYVYKNALQKLFGNTSPSHATFTCESLKELASSLLLVNGQTLTVAERNFAAWQHVISTVPVLPLRIAALVASCSTAGVSSAPAPPNCNSILVHMESRLLDRVLGAQGLAEVHMHLTGTTEADTVWLDALQKPEKYLASLADSFRNIKIKEQLLHVSHLLDSPTSLLRFLRKAQILRDYICQMLRALGNARYQLPSRPALFRLLRSQSMPAPLPYSATMHPFAMYLHGRRTDTHLQQEANWLHATMTTLLKAHNASAAHSIYNDIAIAFHAYLLIQSLFQKLLVQQPRHIGFDHFQRIADNKLRDHSEEKYSRRYKQLYAYHPGGPWHLEGRFAPKDTPEKTAKLLRSIITPWVKLFPADVPSQTHGQQHHANVQSLSLTAHFIKAPDKSKYPRCIRHHEVRKRYMKQAQALCCTLRGRKSFAPFVVSADAAANEMHAPPEVFAPVFRFLKQRGIARFTFHAGEDYQHLASGLRAMWEAITFLDLRPGDRIGHGTAVGIDPKLWMDRFGDSVHLTRQEWLDTLLFAYATLRDSAETNNHCASIADKIREQATLLYGDARPKITTLLAAWHMRTLDPTIAREDPLPTFGLSDYKHAELKRIRKARSEDLTAFTLFLRYHTDAKLKKKGGTLISVKSDAIPLPVLELLQREVIREMNRRHLAMEILPTSNVRISFYNDHAEHHVVRLLKKANTEADPRPIMCVGTDDTGIFSTCLKNEYAHIYRALRACDYSETDALAEIRQLIENAWAFHFPPNRAHPAAPKAAGFSLGR